MAAKQQSPNNAYDLAAERVVELGNRMLDQEADADTWEVASGLLAGAIQFWLFSRQPCDDPFCETCAEVSTAERRLRKLMDEARELAEDSDYYASPRDVNAGTA
ncbi:MAG: hypothetical protein IT486_09900 [Gammaproteobacteria bacterium]|nr:hypothetical protein [Gammaproteobacteria bacterium]